MFPSFGEQSINLVHSGIIYDQQREAVFFEFFIALLNGGVIGKSVEYYLMK